MWLLSWFPPPSHREMVSSRCRHIGLFLSFPSALQAIPPARLPSASLPWNHFPRLPIFTNIQDSLLPSADHQSLLPRSWHCFYLDFMTQQLSGCLVSPCLSGISSSISLPLSSSTKVLNPDSLSCHPLSLLDTESILNGSCCIPLTHLNQNTLFGYKFYVFSLLYNS